MEIVSADELYSVENAIPMIISIVLFSLQSVVGMMDTHTYLLEGDIGEGVVSRGRLLYSYFVGYITYILKVTSMLFSLYILLTIVRVGVVVVFNMLVPLGSSGSMADKFKGALFDKFKEAIKGNLVWFMGIYLIDNFLKSFFVFAPLLVFVTLAGFAIFVYNPESMRRYEENDENEKARAVVNTVHHHVMFYLGFVVVVLIVYMIGNFISQFSMRNPVE